MSNNNLTFSIEKVFGTGNVLKGYFVSKTNKAPSADIMQGLLETMAKAMGETAGEAYKEKADQPEKLFCSDEKEILDFIKYQVGEFTQEK